MAVDMLRVNHRGGAKDTNNTLGMHGMPHPIGVIILWSSSYLDAVMMFLAFENTSRAAVGPVSKLSRPCEATCVQISIKPIKTSWQNKWKVVVRVRRCESSHFVHASAIQSSCGIFVSKSALHIPIKPVRRLQKRHMPVDHDGMKRAELRSRTVSTWLGTQK